MKFFFAQDNNCRWYLVEATRAKDWEYWLSEDRYAPMAWKVPNFATHVANISGFEFDNPTEVVR